MPSFGTPAATASGSMCEKGKNMTDILISLLMLVAFGGAWALLFKVGGLDWMVDARMVTARRMLSDSKFAFDGEVHAHPLQVAAKTVGPAPLPETSEWIPRRFAHA